MDQAVYLRALGALALVTCALNAWATSEVAALMDALPGPGGASVWTNALPFLVVSLLLGVGGLMARKELLPWAGLFALWCIWLGAQAAFPEDSSTTGSLVIASRAAGVADLALALALAAGVGLWYSRWRA